MLHLQPTTVCNPRAMGLGQGKGVAFPLSEPALGEGVDAVPITISTTA
jgi:hypothetical protein